MSKQVSTNITKTMNRLSISILFAAIGVGVWGWFADGHLTDPSARSNRPIDKSLAVASTEGSGNQIRSSKESTSASGIWSRKLQSGFIAKSSPTIAEPKTLSNVPVPNAIAPRSAAPDAGLRLVGTVIEKGRSMAIAIDRVGKLDFCPEGNSIQLEPDGVRVESVDRDSVRVSFRGQSATWLMGQMLRFESDVGLEATAMPMQDSNSKPMTPKPKLSFEQELEEELERINGDSPTIPL